MFLSLSKGVPQGATLGPVLLTIYTNKITSSVTNCNGHLYADDTIQCCCDKSAHKAITIVQQAFDKLQESLFKPFLKPNS